MLTWSEVTVPGEEGVERVSGVLPKPCRENDEFAGTAGWGEGEVGGGDIFNCQEESLLGTGPGPCPH